MSQDFRSSSEFLTQDLRSSREFFTQDLRSSSVFLSPCSQVGRHRLLLGCSSLGPLSTALGCPGLDYPATTPGYTSVKGDGSVPQNVQIGRDISDKWKPTLPTPREEL